MSLILGIDTGGTFTDGVLIDYETKEVKCSAKAFTTKEDLSIGIAECIDRLHMHPEDEICLVSLSTTLATNAVVEKKELPVGLITIGASQKHTYPASITIPIRGKLDVMGRELMPVYEEEIKEALWFMKGKVQALAISGYASVRNPVHELKVCELAAQILNVPVVCAYELTSTLGYYERTVTAVLNAKLIPIITNLIDKTRSVLRAREIYAPIIIVKGDGHLMVDNFAESHPVETILSGPAASMIGGRYLTELENAIVVDMGGTTTDIVFVEDGNVVIEPEGATVGGWKTRVRAVQVKSYGLGGDSYITVDNSGNINILPYRVMPLCVAADQYPNLIEEIETRYIGKDYHLIYRMETDCFRLYKPIRDTDELSEREMELLELLQDGAHSALYLAERLDVDIDTLGIDALLQKELVQLISVTPTDILHAKGECTLWNQEIAVLAASIYGQATNRTREQFIQAAEEAVVCKLSRLIMRSVLEADGLNTESCGDEVTMLIVDTLLGIASGTNMLCNTKFNKPMIGIGAPANAWVAKAAKYMGAEFILPPHESVANAVGAAVSNVRETVSAMITFDQYLSKFVAFMPGKRMEFETLEEAKQCCREEIRSYAEELTQKLAITKADINIVERDESIDDLSSGQEVYVQTRIEAQLAGEIEVNRSV